MVSLTTVSMAESSGGGPGSPTPGQLASVPKMASCVSCRAPLPHPSVPFCTVCGYSQIKCINSQCGKPVPPAALFCPYCRTSQLSQEQSAKECINPQCGAPLHPIAMHCATCSAPQDPVMFQQFLSAAHCISCSAKLLIPGQNSCHMCGTPQSTQTSMGHGGQHPLPHVSQPSHPHTLPCVSADAPVSQPSTPYLHTSQLPYPHASQPALLAPQTTYPHTSQHSLLPHSPQATPPHTSPPSDIPQSTPYSRTDSTVQQHVSLAKKRSPDSETLINSTQKRSKMEVKLANIYVSVHML